MNSLSLPKSEYHALLSLNPESAVWTWHQGLVDPRVLPQLAARLPGLVGRTLADHKERPLGIFLARLLLELGVISHDGDTLDVREPFLNDKGRVDLRFSVGSPWGVHEVSPEAINEFLGVALVVGDGFMKDIAHQGADGGGRGYEVDRTLELLWDAALTGRGAFRPEHEPEDLVFAFDRSGELRLVSCGKPRFGAISTEQLHEEGWVSIKPPIPHAMFPATYLWRDPLGRGEKRFYIPGTEAGCELNLYGGAFEAGAVDRSALGAHFKDEGASLRVHLEYVPGWQTVPVGRQNVYVWSELADYMKGKLMERSVLVRES